MKFVSEMLLKTLFTCCPSHHELKRDFDVLRTDYSDLISTKNINTPEDKRNHENHENGENLKNQPHAAHHPPSSYTVGDSETIVAESESEVEMEKWMVAQKGAIGRIDELQEQINNYREKLLDRNKNEHIIEEDVNFKLDLGELKEDSQNELQ